MKSLLALALVSLPAVPLVQEPGPPPRPTPDQFPAPLRPYLEAADGLDGLEMSLTWQVAIALGSAAERKGLGRDWKDSAEHHRDAWNAALGAFLAEVGPRAADARAGGAMFHDTGVKLDPKTGAFEILRQPETRFAADDDFAERFERRRLVAALLTRDGLSEDDAKALQALIDREVGELSEIEDPWVGHARTHAMLMSFGMWAKRYDDMAEKGTPFGPVEKFLATVHEHARDALVTPLRPALPGDVTAGRNFRYEGDVALVLHGEGDEPWTVPGDLSAVNAVDHVPILVVEAAPPKRWTEKAKLERVRVGMVAGGAYRPIYDGAWPLR